jgi:hypothetical protein
VGTIKASGSLRDGTTSRTVYFVGKISKFGKAKSENPKIATNEKRRNREIQKIETYKSPKFEIAKNGI